MAIAFGVISPSLNVEFPSCRSPIAKSYRPHSTAPINRITCPKSGVGLETLSQRKWHRTLFCNASKSSLRIQAALKNVDISKVVPQADRVLVRLEELSEKSVGGVLLPKSAVKFERYLIGEVLSVGKEVGAIEKGQKVVFSDLNAYEVDLGTTEKLCFCKAGDLLAVVA